MATSLTASSKAKVCREQTYALHACTENSPVCSHYVLQYNHPRSLSAASPEAPAASANERFRLHQRCGQRRVAAAAAEVTVAMAGRYAFRDGAVYTGGFARNLQNGHGESVSAGRLAAGGSWWQLVAAGRGVRSATAARQ
jgi:hypothetical protein